MALPKLEGVIEVPSGGWDFVYTTHAGHSLNIAAGTYYLTSIGSGTRSLLDEFANACTGVGHGTVTATLDDTLDTATGKVTLANGGPTNFGITWTDSDLRDALGFGGDITVTAATYTGTKQAQYLWLPNCGRDPSLMAPDGDAGTNEEDFSQVVAPSGRVQSYRIGSGRYVDQLGFSHIRGSKAWITYEVTTNESLQTFWQTVIREGFQFRYVPDRSVDGTYVTWVSDAGGAFACKPVDASWWKANALYTWGTRVRKYVA